MNENLFADLRSGQRIFIQGGAATPNFLIRKFVESAKKYQNLEVVHLHTIGDPLYAMPEYRQHIKVSNLFVGPNMRKFVGQNGNDYLPCFLSEIPNLFRSGRRQIDVALIHVSLPDAHGYCSLGVSVDVAKAAIDSAKMVIAQINPRMPRVHGDGIIHVSKIHKYVNVNEELPEEIVENLSDVEVKIGKLVASLVEDGSTLQVGIGAIPNATLQALKNHKHLGVHTEMWSDGVLDLIQCGAVDNSLKKVHPGKTVSGFLIGSRRLYDFVNDNPSVVQLDIGYVNSPVTIARNPKVVAINSAVQIDITGQVCADSVGRRIISGVGGQMDFIRGASLSPGGKPIIAFTSRTKKGISRIVPMLEEGAGVVTTRAHVHYVVTEYGVADLYGKTLRERAKLLVDIAHPEDRERLEKFVQA